MKQGKLIRRAVSGGALAGCMMFTFSAPGAGRKHRCADAVEHDSPQRRERAGRGEQRNGC